jgi:hypothetical protein
MFIVLCALHCWGFHFEYSNRLCVTNWICFVSINDTVIIYQQIIPCKPLQRNSVNDNRLRQKNTKFLEFLETQAQMKPEKAERLM